MFSPVASSAPRRASARALLPVEHGLWCWICTPLLGALLLAPSAGTLLAALSVLALFGAGNAARSRAWTVAGVAMAVSAVLGLAAVPLLDSPRLWLAALGAVVVGGAVVVETAGRAIGRKVRGHTAYELAAIGGFGAIGAVIALAAGAPGAATVAVGLALVAWQVIGLWWVRGQLARVLPNRAPWRAGAPAAVTLALGSGAVAVALGLPLLAPLPALYLLRAGFTRAVTSGRDARRIGLSEAGWAAGVTVLAALVAGVA